jgi:uncharacterized integral membrane protein
MFVMSILHRSSVEQGIHPARATLGTSQPPLDHATGPVPPRSQPATGSRLGSVWVGVWAAAALAILLIIFMVQNTGRTRVSFLGFSGTTSLSVALLVAAVGGIVLTLLVGTARITQLRHRARVGMRRAAPAESGRTSSHA